MNTWQKAIKIALSAVISSYIALWLGLVNPLSAGVVAILSVLDTRLDSIRTGLARILSTILAFAVATIVFYFLGMSYWAFGIFLFIYIPLAYNWGLEAGIAPCSVLVTHFMVNNSLAISWHLNGLGLMIIGVAIAILFNLFMTSYKDQLDHRIIEIEESFRKLLLHIRDRLLTESQDVQPLKIESQNLLNQLQAYQSLALIEYDNQVTDKDEYYIEYGRMRMRQGRLLEQMIHSLENIGYYTDHNQGLAELFEVISREFDESNSGLDLLERLAQLFKDSRDSPLPKNRQEFETRAILYHLLFNLEHFLQLKNNFYQDWQLKK